MCLEVAKLFADFVKVVVCEAKHLENSAEEQDVTAQLQLQLITVVLHWHHTGQRHTQAAAHLLGLEHTTEWHLAHE